MPFASNQLRQAVYRVGNYAAPVGGPAGPSLRTPGGVAFNGQEMLHFIVNNGVVSYAEAGDTQIAGARKISFSPAAGHNQAVYLPYRDNNISSATLGAGVGRFFTDSLSGCTIFIDRLPNNDLVVYHANVQGGAAAPTPEQASVPTFEKPYAIFMKRRLHRDASAHYNGALVGELFKATYNRMAVGRVTFGGSALAALGTTVCGFRTGGGWEFWYQTWARNVAGGAVILDVARFANGL